MTGFDIGVLVWPVFAGFVIWGAVVVRRTIREVEGPDAEPVKGPAFTDGWARATGPERGAFIAMGLAVLVWTALILFIPWAIAMGVVAWLVWHRPYLRAPLGRLLVIYGVAGAIVSLPFGGDGGPGAIVFGVAIFAVAALVPGVLLLLADRSQLGNASGSSSAQMPDTLP